MIKMISVVGGKTGKLVTEKKNFAAWSSKLNQANKAKCQVCRMMPSDRVHT